MSEKGVGRPEISEGDVIAFVHRVYGLVVTGIKALPSYSDQNYRVQTEQGIYVFKIANGNEETSVLDLQNKAMAHLQVEAPTLLAPRVIPALMGAEIVPLTTDDGQQYDVRLLSYLPGVPMAQVKRQTPTMWQELGGYVGTMDKALASFSHSRMAYEFDWDMQHAVRVIGQYLEAIEDEAGRQIVQRFLTHFETAVVPRFSTLRRSVIHNDANEYNVLVAPLDKTGDGLASRPISGLIDFGDVVYSYTVFDLAVACAYAMLGKRDPLATAMAIVQGYHAVYPLTEAEIDVLFTCMCIRTCTSVVMAAYKKKLEPDNAYISVSEAPGWALLTQFKDMPFELATYHFRQALGLEPHPQAAAVRAWLGQQRPAPVVAVDLATDAVVLDLSVGSPLTVTGETAAFVADAGGRVSIGRYNEARLIYAGDDFATETGERRTIHMGMDVGMAAGTAVYAPFAGVVHSFADNDAPFDYGPTIILQHEADGVPFYTLYGHLSRESLVGLAKGKRIAAGEKVAEMGDESVNGGWPPHLHFQVMLDMLGREGEFPGVAPATTREVWLSLCPDPNLILNVPQDKFPPTVAEKEALLQKRQQIFGYNLSIAYKKHLKMVRGIRQYLYDENGHAYLDVVNNVCHVGHSHPKVVHALQQQALVLNTNTRYLHDNLIAYAERLTAKFPDPLSVCFFVCTGSEANELALRLARAHTGRRDVMVVDAAYHGHTSALIELSPYKFKGRGGAGEADYVHTMLLPDGYRGRFCWQDGDVGERYAAVVAEEIERLGQNGRLPAAFFCESLLGCGGQIVLPDNYLAEVYKHVRAAGGVCVADEVQVGFGRVGSHFWGFETQGVVPDIVTMGKPIGNGHPLAAVVTTPEIAASFNNGMEYFNTFGGNPVSCAVGLAVLDVIEEEGLQANALRVGERLRAGLSDLMARYPIIGDVRGLGLFVGAELVLDRKAKTPAAAQASYVAERMRDHNILISTDGPDHNVLKMKPPITFSEVNADHLVATLDKVLAEGFVQVG